MCAPAQCGDRPARQGAGRTTSGAAVSPPRAVTIPREFVTTIHGKEFVQYAGLLAMAHSQGLTSLRAELVSVTPDLALAKATAVFADGRTFSEAADATPDNVNAGVRKHFARCALTRAKARALRDALNIGTWRWKSWTDPQQSAAAVDCPPSAAVTDDHTQPGDHI